MWLNPGEIAGNGIDDDGNGYVDDVLRHRHRQRRQRSDGRPRARHAHGRHHRRRRQQRRRASSAWPGTPSILACKFVDSAGSGTDADAIECFNYIVALKQRGINIRVSNNSWGEPARGSAGAVLKAAIDAAGAAGILNVFAAGNDGTNNDVTCRSIRPASPRRASSRSPRRTSRTTVRRFSNYGATSVDLAAPGDLILSTVRRSYAFAERHEHGGAARRRSGGASRGEGSGPVGRCDEDTVDANRRRPSAVGRAGVSGGRLNRSSAPRHAAGGNIPPSVALTSPASGAAFPVVGSRDARSDRHATATARVSQVDFYANGSLVGTDTTGVRSLSRRMDVGDRRAHYTLTAVATDDGGATRTSSPVTITLTPPPGRVNVALAANGGIAVASSLLQQRIPPAV